MKPLNMVMVFIAGIPGGRGFAGKKLGGNRQSRALHGHECDEACLKRSDHDRERVRVTCHQVANGDGDPWNDAVEAALTAAMRVCAVEHHGWDAFEDLGSGESVGVAGGEGAEAVGAHHPYFGQEQGSQDAPQGRWSVPATARGNCRGQAEVRWSGLRREGSSLGSSLLN